MARESLAQQLPRPSHRRRLRLKRPLRRRDLSPTEDRGSRGWTSPGGPGGRGLGPPGQGTFLLSAAGPRARGERVCTDSPESGQGRGAVLTGWVRAGACRPEGVPPRLRVPGAAVRLAPSATCLPQSLRRPRAGGGPCSPPVPGQPRGHADVLRAPVAPERK